jgi:hypothetical protein
MSMGRRQFQTLYLLGASVVPEPVLPRLKTGSHGVTTLTSMFRGVLIGGAVATADMPALCTASQVQPPTIRRKAFDTAGAARF